MTWLEKLRTLNSRMRVLKTEVARAKTQLERAKRLAKKERSKSPTKDRVKVTFVEDDKRGTFASAEGPSGSSSSSWAQSRYAALVNLRHKLIESSDFPGTYLRAVNAQIAKHQKAGETPESLKPLYSILGKLKLTWGAWKSVAADEFSTKRYVRTGSHGSGTVLLLIVRQPKSRTDWRWEVEPKFEGDERLPSKFRYPKENRADVTGGSRPTQEAAMLAAAKAVGLKA